MKKSILFLALLSFFMPQSTKASWYNLTTGSLVLGAVAGAAYCYGFHKVLEKPIFDGPNGSEQNTLNSLTGLKASALKTDTTITTDQHNTTSSTPTKERQQASTTTASSSSTTTVTPPAASLSFFERQKAVIDCTNEQNTLQILIDEQNFHKPEAKDYVRDFCVVGAVTSLAHFLSYTFLPSRSPLSTALSLTAIVGGGVATAVVRENKKSSVWSRTAWFGLGALIGSAFYATFALLQ